MDDIDMTQPASDDIQVAHDSRWTAAERAKLPDSDFAGPGETFPIRTQQDVDDAAKLIGHASDPDAVKRRIIAIAKRKGLTIPEAWQTTGDDAASDSELATDVFVAAFGEWQILADAAPDGLMRVRQLATIADAVNLNGRLYPRAVVQACLPDARRRARAKAMVGERRHPRVAKVDGTEIYVDNHDRKSNRVDDIEDVGADGAVWVTRTILDTPHGQAVADAFRSGRPEGVSIRWKMGGDSKMIDGRKVFVADRLQWLYLDDVPNPAFPQTKANYQLLTDEAREQLGLPRADDGSDIGAAGRPASAHEEKTMNQKIKSALNEVYGLINRRANPAQIAPARKALSDEIELARRAGDDIADATREALKVDDAMAMAGYHADRPGPFGVDGAKVGGRGAGTGWGAEIEKAADKPEGAPASGGSASGDAEAKGSPGMTDEELAEWRSEREQRRKAKAESDAAKAADDKKAAIKAACDSLGETVLRGLPVEDQELIVRLVLGSAADATDVPRLAADQMDALAKRLSIERLRGGGFDPSASANGQTTNDPARHGSRSPAVAVSMHPAIDAAFGDKGRAPEWMEGVARLCAAADDHVRSGQVQGACNPDASDTRSRRIHNLRRLYPILNDYATRFHGVKTAAEWFAREDTIATKGEQAFADAVSGGKLASDATTTANFFNQPTILTALLIQSFWDLNMFQYVQGIGPGESNGEGAGWYKSPTGKNGEMGSLLRLPVEYLNQSAMSGAAGAITNNYQPGLAVPEGSGIDYLQVATNWLSYAPVWRRIAAQPTRDVIRAMGNGPLNYNVVGRMLFHAGFLKQRVIDKAMGDEFFNTSDEYGAVAVSAESPNYADNSVYNAAGSITVNLNPAKVASATVAATDPYVTYGANVVAAIRFQTRGSGSASPYAGTLNGVDPIVRPRTNYTLTSQGQISTSVTNPVTVTQAGGSYNAPVLGYIDGNGQVQSAYGISGTANCAVDWNNGVIVFTANYNALVNISGVCANAASSTTTLTYSYATNFDNFVVNNPTLGTGITMEMYLNGLLRQMDATAALMGSSGRYVKPDLAIMSLAASTWVTGAQIFYQWASPKGTNLFPTEDYFAERTGVMMGRTNVPWIAGDSRIVLSQIGAQKYGIDTPAEVRGPQFPFDSSGRPVASEVYYLEENSVICTPQVTDQSGNIYNPVSRTIRLR